jgi:hypothetical protein
MLLMCLNAHICVQWMHVCTETCRISIQIKYSNLCWKINILIHAYLCLHVYVYTFIYIYAYTCIDINVWTHVYKYTYVHAYLLT